MQIAADVIDPPAHGTYWRNAYGNTAVGVKFKRMNIAGNQHISLLGQCKVEEFFVLLITAIPHVVGQRQQRHRRLVMRDPRQTLRMRSPYAKQESANCLPTQTLQRTPLIPKLRLPLPTTYAADLREVQQKALW